MTDMRPMTGNPYSGDLVMSAHVTNMVQLASGRYKLSVSYEGKRIEVVLGTVGSFWYARIDNAATPFNSVMATMAAVHVWMTDNKLKPGNHNVHAPAVIGGAIIKNWQFG